MPLFPSVSDALGRQGFVRMVNRSGKSGEVTLTANDESNRSYEALALTLEPGETVHFNSNDLEVGNADKGPDREHGRGGPATGVSR